MRDAIEGRPAAAARRRLGQLLVIAALALAARPVAEWIHAMHYQRAHLRGFVEPGTASRPPGNSSALAHAPRRGQALGTLEIPRLGVRVVVAHGDDAGTLAVAVGHLPDTPFPWDVTGNSVLAGHRDTFFRPLQRIEVGDDVVFRPFERSTRWYRVTNTWIVEPEDLSVLAPGASPSLTLITCYPFDYVGAAPRRFVVRAVRV